MGNILDILSLIAIFLIYIMGGVIIYKLVNAVWVTILKIIQKLFPKS